MSRAAATGTSSVSTALATIQVEPSRLHATSLQEYGVRFAFGGLATVAVGIVATAFGPSVAGLFLAFPAILIASLTLVGSHDGAAAAGADALGAAAGAIGLVTFGAIVWKLSPHLSGVLTIALASVVWLIVSVTIWMVFDVYRRHRKD
jgi:uncharacterized membrane protein (GlpM family)